jgi:hypothetical protein
MNSELKNRIYAYEVTPPATVWNKIADELDESHLADQFPKKLFQSNIAPPASAWESISASLGMETVENEFPSVLYNLEASPPAAAWNKIEAALDAEATPKRKLVSMGSWVRYAAAAVVLAAVTYGGLRILNSQQDSSTDIAVTGTTPTSVESNPVAPQQNEKTAPSEELTRQSIQDEARNDAALEQSKQTYASLGASDKKRMKKVSSEYFQAPADPIEISANFNPVHTYEELACSEVSTPSFANNTGSIEIAGRYAMLMTPDGHFIRISRKLGNLVCCVSGEDQDEECVDQLKKWRKKLANSPVTPSPGNFMDIVDLINTLKDTNL